MLAGTVPKPSMCAGCKGRLDSSKALECCFAIRPFDNPQDPHSSPLRACGVAYHPDCISVGEPFRSRHSDGRGLKYPDAAALPGFVCEACTVRAMLGRELALTDNDQHLLRLERMRMIDAAHAWAPSTTQTYRAGVRRICKFEAHFGITALRRPTLDAPPTDPAIALMWSIQDYAIKRPRGTHPASGDQMKYNTVRALRSAASYYYEGLLLLEHPESCLRDPTSNRPRLSPGRLPSDHLGFTHMASGMARRMGTSTRPSKALRYEHIKWNLAFRDKQWRDAHDAHARYETSAAACVEIFSWLGWLRGGEVFGLDGDSVLKVTPDQGISHGLPRGVGYLALVLAESTKSSPTVQADVILAWLTAGNIQAGLWFERLERDLAALGWLDEGPLFRHRDGTVWDSHYFRHTHLYPLLQLQRAEGDPILSQCTNMEGNTIENLYYSMHMYRRGGRTQVTRAHEAFRRKATPLEVTEHGRWRINAAQNMPAHYNEWEVPERIRITMLCM